MRVSRCGFKSALIAGLAIIFVLTASPEILAEKSEIPESEPEIVYAPDILVPLLLREGMSRMLAADFEIRYFQNFSAPKNQDHIARYVTAYIQYVPLRERVMALVVRMTFIHENWAKDDDRKWSIIRRVAADEDMDGSIDSDRCTEVIEDENGRVFDLFERPCEGNVKDFVGDMSKWFANPPSLL